MPKKNEKINPEDLFDNLLEEAFTISLNSLDNSLGIVEFAEQVIFNEEGKLYPTQKAILKALYNEPLTEDELLILYSWKDFSNKSRTTWVDGRKYKNLVMEIGRRGSKCLATDTLLPTSKGLLYIEELVDKNGKEWQPISKDIYTVHERGLEAEVYAGYNNGLSGTHKITTYNGYTLEGTSNHRIKVLDIDGTIKWKYLDEIRTGDIACINRSSNLWATDYLKIKQEELKPSLIRPYKVPNTLTESFGYILGLLVGKGTWEKHGIQITSYKLDYVEYLPYIKEVFGENSVSITCPKNSDNIRYLSIGNNSLKRFIDSLGYCFNNKNEKQIPWSIRKSPKSVVAAFLSGLFDTDGTVVKEGRQIEFSTKSESLAYEVQLLLLNFGIISKRKKSLNKKYNRYYWKVILLGLRSRQIFNNEIGFRLQRKQKIVEQGLLREGGYVESIPYQEYWLNKCLESCPVIYGDYIKDLISSKFVGRKSSEKAYKSKIRGILGNAIKLGSKENLTYSRVFKLLSFYENNPQVNIDKEVVSHFKELLGLDYFFDKVNSVDQGYSHTLDISVPGPEAYIAGGFTNHNSSMVSFIVLYEFYKLINRKQPAVDYGFLPQTPLHIFVIAQSLDQVKETIFSAITGYAKGSNYFKKLESDGFIEILTEEIRCNSKNVHIHAKHTSSKSLVGYNLKLLVIDEAARFERDEYGNSKADEIWENVGAGCAAFGDEGMKIAISSAWEPGDYIEKMYDLSEKDPKTLGFRLRTWDVNLNSELTEEKLKSSDAYIKNPIKATLEYEGIRTIKQGTFFIQDNILKAFKGFSKCDTTQIPLNVSNEVGETRYYTGIKINRIETNFNLPSFAHCDYGIKRDGAALAVCSPIEVESKWGISVDTLILWKPYLDTDDLNRGINRIVSFTNCEEIFLEIARHRKIYKFSFDGFQCLEVGSLVFTPNGLVKVENLTKGMSVISQFGENTIVDINQKEDVDLISITTKLGYTLTGTLNHPIKNREDEWIRLDKLNIKDKIKLFSNNIESPAFDFSLPLTKQEHLALITGYLVAEGDWQIYNTSFKRKRKDGTYKTFPKTTQYIGFTNSEKDTINDYVNSFTQVFNSPPNIYKRINKKTNVSCYSLRYAKKEGLKYWNSLNIPTGSWNKEVPEFILQGTDREIGLFLSGLFEGDGSCQALSNSKGGAKVSLVTVSKSLAIAVQLLLLKFGIKSSRKYWHYKQKNGLADIKRYTICIYGHNLINFQKYINFRSNRKKTLLQLALANLSFYRKPRTLYLEDSIVSIERKKGSIVQMEVNGDHSYIANGFINHNSQSTIQRLHLAGISTAEMSTANSMQNTYFSITKQLMDQGLLYLPKDSTWSASAQLELQNIIQLPNGKIDHPKEFSKDLADAICNAVYNCYIFMVQSGKITNSSGLISSFNTVASYKTPNPGSIYKVKNTGWALRKVRSSSVQR